MSSELQQKVLGIDLGTTYCCVSCLDEFGQPVILRNDRNELTTPSVVWFAGNQRVCVGEEAKNMSVVEESQVATGIKRMMGDPHFKFKCREGDFRPEAVSALILRKLVADAWKALGEEVRDVVITCPAYFFVKEREATKLAGELAGLNVLQLVNEPTAAAVAYGVDTAAAGVQKNVLVYDLGGGTFDVTLISVSGKDEIRVICSDGKDNLGGIDWDRALAGILSRQLEEEHDIEKATLSQPELQQELVLTAEKFKKMLTFRNAYHDSIVLHGERLRLEVCREEFERETAGLLNKTLVLIRKVLEQAAHKGYDRIDEVLLVGGSSRMPQVMAAVESELGIRPRLFEPDEAVAKGACLLGTRKLFEMGEISLPSGDSSEIELPAEGGVTLKGLSQLNVTNVCSKSFGSTAYLKNTERLRLWNIIYRNDEIPTESTHTFSTRYDGQASVEVTILENDNDRCDDQGDGFNPDSGTELWKGELKFPRPMPLDHPFHVRFSLDDSGLLSVYVFDPETRSKLEDKIKVGTIVSRDEKKIMYEQQARLIVEN